MSNEKTLPNSTAVLVLGICSIVVPFAGLILGIVGLSLSVKGRKMHAENPELYEGYGLLNAGWIMSIIGTALGGISALQIIGCSAYFGNSVLNEFYWFF